MKFIDDNRPNFEFGKKTIKDESYVDDGFVQEDLSNGKSPEIVSNIKVQDTLKSTYLKMSQPLQPTRPADNVKQGSRGNSGEPMSLKEKFTSAVRKIEVQSTVTGFLKGLTNANA